MASPLAKLRQEALAKQQKQSTAEIQCVANPNSLHLLLAELDSDLKVLKTFNRKDEKVNHKREVLVPKYRDAIEAYLAGDEQFDNPLFTQMVIWQFDIEDLDTAIKWCDIAIDRGLDTPKALTEDIPKLKHALHECDSQITDYLNWRAEHEQTKRENHD